MRNKKRNFFFSAFLCFFLGVYLYSDQTYQFEAPMYHIEITEDGYHRISMPGYYSYGIPGYPDLPSRIYRIALPPDVDGDDIEVEYFETSAVHLGTFRIRELPPMVTWINGERIFGEKADIYSNDSHYPGKVVEYLGLSQMRKWRIINIKYTPFQYNPVTQDLRFIPEVRLSIRFTRPRSRVVTGVEISDRVMEVRAKKILTNYSEAKEWYTHGMAVAKPLQTFDYVIITTNAIESNSTKLSDFMNFLTDWGYSPLLITEDDYSSLKGQSPNGTAEKIREWLKNNYLSYSIKYVLLIGNPDPDDPSLDSDAVGDVPMKMCWPRRRDEGSPDNDEAPTDYFYADLTGDWDLDGDGYFGEYSDDRGDGGVDFANEVYVGRIPVYEGVADLDSVLSKIIRYGGTHALGRMRPMSDTSWRLNALLPMSFSDDSTDGAYLGEAMKSDYLSSAGYSSWTMYMQGSVCAEADSIFSSDVELLDLVVKERWKVLPYGLVWWKGHGSTWNAFIGYGDCSQGTIMSTFDTHLLNDDFPSFVFQGSCDNGRPESSLNLGTALLYNGAIATLSSSRVCWYVVGSWNTGKKYYCDIASIGYFYGKELVGNDKKAAEALYDVKSDMGISGGWFGDESWMNLFDFNLYGDPVTSLKAIMGKLLIISSGTGGTTDPEPGEYTYADETEVSLKATAETNYRFSGWSGDVPEGQESDNPLVLSVDSVISIQANFVPRYNLTIASSAGGTTDPEPGTHTYDDGTEVILTAIPENYYEFGGWSGTVSQEQEGDNPITIIMDSDKSIQASFIRKYDLTISVEGGGTTIPSPGTHRYRSGETVQVKAIADDNYEFSGWSGDVSGTTNPVEITMDSARSIKAAFEKAAVKKKGCFIATAAYGTSLHPCVKILQDFRDTYLMPGRFGRLLVYFYYRYSPFLADFISKHKVLRVAVRASLLPLVAFSYSMLQFGPVIIAFMLVCIFVIPVFLISFYQRKPRPRR